MRIFSVFVIAWILLKLPICCLCARGTLSDLNDESFEMLIAGGYQADNGRLGRHIVSIRTLNKVRYNGDNHFCTGVVISSRIILTAAHCLTDKYKAIMNPGGILVVFGNTRRIEYFNDNESRRVNRIIVHPHYKRFLKNDLALMRLASRIPSNMNNVRPIQRRELITITEGLRCVTMGWGQVYQHGPYTDDMLFLDVIISNHTLCEKNLEYYDREGNLCVEPVVEGEICPGDLGGPLMCMDTLAGIIGGTQQCEGIQAIKFVNFSHYESWVYNTIKDLVDGTQSILICNMWLMLISLQIFQLLV